ncbi:toll/interleukin-1 receptor domain-containing protein [Glaciecola sp. 1036]|uniref:toll/interleukin-1 receptor domain-containing protein n=1 Tax=Alteromonadaceae TaxID=72275 RepID=UPI003CFD9AB8
MNENIDVYDAFISHASEDSERALEIVASLEQQGLKCWIDKRDIRAGKKYAEEIVRGVRQSRCVVVVISRHSNASDNVAAEAEEARKSGKPIFPVRVEDVQPSEKLTFYVSINQWLDLWNADKVGKLEQLAKSIVDPEALANSIIPKPSNLFQYLKNNRLSLLGFAILIITIGVGFWMIKADIGDYANPFGFELPENVEPEDFEKDDIIIMTYPSDGGVRATISIGFEINLSAAAVNKLFNAQYDLNFSNGVDITQTSHGLGLITGIDTHLDNIPEWVSIQISLKNGAVIGPFTYDLNDLYAQIETKREESIERERLRKIEKEKQQYNEYFEDTKEHFAKGRVVRCSDYFGTLTHCKLAVHRRLLINEVFDSVIFFNVKENKSIPVEFMTNQNNPDVLVLESGEPDKYQVILTTSLDGLEYSAKFSDGEKITKLPADTNHRPSNMSLTFEFESLTNDAPRLFATSYPSGGYYKERSKWHLLPFIDNAQEIHWTIFDGGKNSFQKQRTGEYLSYGIPSSELGITYDGSDGPILQLSVIDETGEAETFKYKANWAEWIPSAASASIRITKESINCSDEEVSGTKLRYTICKIDVPEPFTRIFTQVEWGVTPNHLDSFEKHDLEVEYQNLEARINEYFDSKEVLEQLNERYIKNYQKFAKSHLEKLKSDVKQSTAIDETTEYLIIQDAPEAVFFKFSLVNGEQSPVLRVFVK